MKINLLLKLGLLLAALTILPVEPACVVPTKTLPISSFTFRPSTLQVFTALNLTCSGFVTGWRVILSWGKSVSRVSGVYLAVFRQLTASKFQLVGITEVNHVIATKNSSTANKPGDERPGWEIIPARPQFPVQRGDVLGIFYKRWFISEREVSIPVASEQYVSLGTPPAYVAMKDWYDVSEALDSGGVLSMSDAGVVRRLPALQAFVNVGICGNSRIEDAEECDDSNTADGDGCSSLCRNEPSNNGDGFDTTDSWNAMNVCGNGITEPPSETCDDNNRIDGDGCSSKCRLEDPGGPLCGNGKQEPGEFCDDGNIQDGDGCSAECRKEQIAICGNYLLEIGEQCDDGNTVDSDGCNALCQLEGLGTCGNGILEINEQCEDHNNIGGDGCSANCTLEICGNGILDEGEFCDDGNAIDLDGCSSFCTLEISTEKLVPQARHSRRPAAPQEGVFMALQAETSEVEITESPVPNYHFIEPLPTPSPPPQLSILSTTTRQFLTPSPPSSTTTWPMIPPPTAPMMVDFSKYAEGESFALGGVAEMRGTVNYATPSHDPMIYDHRSALRSLEGKMRILPPRRSSRPQNNNVFTFPQFEDRKISGITMSRDVPKINENIAFPGEFSQHQAFYEQKPINTYFIPQMTTREMTTSTSTTTTTTTTSTTPTTTTSTTSKNNPTMPMLLSPAISPKCLEAPLLGGVCRASPQVRWFYNSLTNRCDWFYDKSCYAGANYFESKAACIVNCGLLALDFSDDQNDWSKK